MSTVRAGAINASMLISFYDKDGQEAVPDSAEYRVLGQEKGGVWQELRSLTTISPLAAIVQIVLEAQDTALIGAGPQEKRRICVYANDDFWSDITFDVVDSMCGGWPSKATSVTVEAGNTVSTVIDLQKNDDTDYVLNEVAGTPGFSLVVDFIGVMAAVSTFRLWGFYDGNLGHTVQVQAWNFLTSSYDVVGTLVDEVTEALHEFTLVDANHRSNGACRVRVYHVSPGNPNHKLHINYVEIG
jgi:hypothetical protein